MATWALRLPSLSGANVIDGPAGIRAGLKGAKTLIGVIAGLCVP
jgi:hypothetical protein